MDATGTSVIQSGEAVSGTIDMVQSLRWQNSSANVVDTERVRVGSSTCGTSCTANDIYRVRTYETTLASRASTRAGRR